jgi:hypothetical protein
LNPNEIDSIFISTGNEYSQSNNLKLLLKAMKSKRSTSFSSGEGERDIVSPELDDENFRALSS